MVSLYRVVPVRPMHLWTIFKKTKPVVNPNSDRTCFDFSPCSGCSLQCRSRSGPVPRVALSRDEVGAATTAASSTSAFATDKGPGTSCDDRSARSGRPHESKGDDWALACFDEASRKPDCGPGSIEKGGECSHHVVITLINALMHGHPVEHAFFSNKTLAIRNLYSNILINERFREGTKRLFEGHDLCMRRLQAVTDHNSSITIHHASWCCSQHAIRERGTQLSTMQVILVTRSSQLIM